MGDLTGRALVLFPERSAYTVCDFLFRRPVGTTQVLGEMEQSGLKEAGNILASAYLNALSDFMGMMLDPVRTQPGHRFERQPCSPPPSSISGTSGTTHFA